MNVTVLFNAVNMQDGFEPGKVRHALACLAAGRLYVRFPEHVEHGTPTFAAVVDGIDEQLRMHAGLLNAPDAGSGSLVPEDLPPASAY